MYQFPYAEVLDDAPKAARERERQALEHCIALLRSAQAQGPRSREAVEALVFLRKLWTTFIEDLASSENDLPKALRADLISIGLWVMREAESIRLEKSDSFQELIEVCEAIREGLK
jgi:flagellar biosynthesis activator protein FlaF